jgi:hypothetical protein
MDRCPFCGADKVEGEMQTIDGSMIGFQCGVLYLIDTKEVRFSRPIACYERTEAYHHALLGEVVKYLESPWPGGTIILAEKESWTNDLLRKLEEAQGLKEVLK